ncbi:hypothetical protein [Pectobacterium wasabiae]|uniref:hypothetical protein n=1 Tax=Pectobacterium wasabiae TaxID=55208 RepID=UPI00027B0B56|nr:hypothetical protein [Pectobacterium wasabiae]EJS96572.1 Hypothetical protein Y17_0450 [Pectobacterium wasabiae CFBP 3304]
MKNIKKFIAVIAFSTLSFGAFAAQEITTSSILGAKIRIKNIEMNNLVFVLFI